MTRSDWKTEVRLRFRMLRQLRLEHYFRFSLDEADGALVERRVKI